MMARWMIFDPFSSMKVCYFEMICPISRSSPSVSPDLKPLNELRDEVDDKPEVNPTGRSELVVFLL